MICASLPCFLPRKVANQSAHTHTHTHTMYTHTHSHTTRTLTRYSMQMVKHTVRKSFKIPHGDVPSAATLYGNGPKQPAYRAHPQRIMQGSGDDTKVSTRYVGSATCKREYPGVRRRSGGFSDYGFLDFWKPFGRERRRKRVLHPVDLLYCIPYCVLCCHRLWLLSVRLVWMLLAPALLCTTTVHTRATNVFFNKTHRHSNSSSPPN